MMSRLGRLFRRPKPRVEATLEDTHLDLESTMKAHLDVVRRGHVIVRTGDEWVAYRAGRRGRWDQWRAIQMLGGLDSYRVGTQDLRPPNVNVEALPVCPDTFPQEWVNG